MSHVKGCNYARVGGIKSCETCDNEYLCRREINKSAKSHIILDDEEIFSIERSIDRMRFTGFYNWEIGDIMNLCDFAQILDDFYSYTRTKNQQIQIAIKAAWTLGYSLQDYTDEEKRNMGQPSVTLNKPINKNQHEITGIADDGRKYCVKCGLYAEYCDKPCVAKK